MKFNFNEAFLQSLNSLLDTREKTLKEYLEVNFVHVDDLTTKGEIEDITDKLSNLEEIIENSELEYKDLSNYVESDEICDYVENEIEERSLVTFSDLEEAFQNSHLESRIKDLETLSFSQDQNDQNTQRIKSLEQENQELKDRLLHIENFLLKTFKGFSND